MDDFIVKQWIYERCKNQKYHCANGAFHDYKCCDTCWNLHPDARPNEDYRLRKGTKYPCQLSDGSILALDGI